MSKGTTLRIRAEITQRPLSAAQLSKLLGEPLSTVATLLSRLVNAQKAFIYDRTPKRYVASEWRQPPKSARKRALLRVASDYPEDIRVAQPITIPGYHFRGRGGPW